MYLKRNNYSLYAYYINIFYTALEINSEQTPLTLIVFVYINIVGIIFA